MGKVLLALLASFTFVVACTPRTHDQNLNAVNPINLGAADGIIGGESVLMGDPIGMTTVGIVNRTWGQVVCTGTLIAQNLVLTAAHCTKENPNELAILFALEIPQTRRQAREAQVRNVIAGATHPLWPTQKFNTQSDWSDIALLRFDGQLPSGYRPAKLLTDATALVAGGEVTLAGFGLTDGRTRRAAEGMNKVKVQISQPLFGSTEVVLDQRNGGGACHGDSGGPAFIDIQGQQVVFGVTSRGYQDDADTCEKYSIYTNVAAYGDFLHDTAQELQTPEAIGRPIPQPRF